jgi:prepilin-type N-terminal cleavage/methylation domain-containing protein
MKLYERRQNRASSLDPRKKRVPLLACPAVSSLPVQHCRTSQQWHPLNPCTLWKSKLDDLLKAELRTSFDAHNLTQRTRSGGFTLVELLVVIAIIAMLVSALVPAVQAMRSTARRAQCRNQLLQLVMAAQNYEMAHEHFPAGVTDPAPGPIRNVAQGHHHAWIISLLPYLDEANVHRRIDFDAGVYDPGNQEVRAHMIPKLICPADWDSRTDAQSSYAACHHGQEAPIDSTNRGVFFLNSQIMIDDVRDGLSQTIFLGEKLIDVDDLGWMSGTRATLRNTGTPVNLGRGLRELAGDVNEQDPEDTTQPQQVSGGEEDPRSSVTVETQLAVGGFSSSHQGGAHVAFGDGRIQYMDPQIDPRVYELLGDRDDGTLLRVEDYRE